MKLFLGLAIFTWFFFGLVGAWMLEGSSDLHFTTIALGPFTLVRAFNDQPASTPGQ
jgi:hypothetical protein